MADQTKSRRELLRDGGALAGLAATAGATVWSKVALAQSEELVPFTDMPDGFTGSPVAPGRMHYLDSRTISDYYTPTDDFYIVQHYNQPEIDPSAFRLRVTGMVERPLEFTLDDLMSRQKVEIDAGFECGGNSERIFQGLIGNARWGGVSLSELLSEAGLEERGVEIVFFGADRGVEDIRGLEVEQSFGRSMHVDEAMRPEVMLAYEMNGAPLNLYHGAPLRLIVPGWYGVSNVKWLSQIHVQDRRFQGRFMARDYVTLSRSDVGGEERWEERTVSYMQLKSAIARVTRAGDHHNISGFVLNDGTPLRSVEVKIDDGPWREAEIDPNAGQFAWKLFNYEWRDAAPGEHTIISRVTDANGVVQPTAEELPEKPTRWENNAQFPRTVMIS